MTKQKQMKFVNELMSDVRDGLIAKINKENLPDDWGGPEIVQLILDAFVNILKFYKGGGD